MAIFNLITNEKINQPPNQIGNLSLSLSFNTDYIFTKADFTTSTSPIYQDPEGDDPEELKVVTLPSIGILNLNSIPVSIDDNISFSLIEGGDLVYTPDTGEVNGYSDNLFTFDISDKGSNTFSGLTPGVVTFTVGGYINQPPSSVGDGSATMNYGETLVFTRNMLTSALVPAYTDPEGDAATALKVTSIPDNGVLKNNGAVIVVNDIINFSDIDLGLFTYTGDLNNISGSIETFSFQIADIGSGIFVG